MNLLLPYANNANGKLVSIDNAQKGDKYTCPNCGAELLLKNSKIPEAKNIIEEITLLISIIWIIIARNRSYINYLRKNVLSFSIKRFWINKVYSLVGNAKNALDSIGRIY